MKDSDGAPRDDVLDRETLAAASQKYDDEGYPDDIYIRSLAALRGAKVADATVVATVERLFLWKLGKIALKPTPTAQPLPYVDLSGRCYYGIGMTGANRAAIERAVEAPRLNTGLAFRDGELSFEEFRSFASGITHGTIVLPAFYVHIWRPDEHPILDRNVWGVYCSECGRRITRWTAPASWAHYAAYTAFFRKLAARTRLDARTIDRGLWVLGSKFWKRQGRDVGRAHCRGGAAADAVSH